LALAAGQTEQALVEELHDQELETRLSVFGRELDGLVSVATADAPDGEAGGVPAVGHAPTGPVDPATLAELYRQLDALFASHDAAGVALAEAHAADLSSGLGPDFANLQDALWKFDFAAAQAVLARANQHLDPRSREA
jgi:hypothetical protein